MQPVGLVSPPDFAFDANWWIAFASIEVSNPKTVSPFSRSMWEGAATRSR